MIKYTLERAGDLKDPSKLMSFGDFLEHHRLELVVVERMGERPDSDFRYVAYIRGADFHERHTTYQDAGGDPQEAIEKLAKIACGRVLVVKDRDYLDTPLPDRHIQFPNEWLSVLD